MVNVEEITIVLKSNHNARFPEKTTLNKETTIFRNTIFINHINWVGLGNMYNLELVTYKRKIFFFIKTLFVSMFLS